MSVCPFARGYLPQELDCALARDYWCDNMGSLPCTRYEERIRRARGGEGS